MGVRAAVKKKLVDLDSRERKAVVLMGDAQIAFELYAMFKRADKGKTGKVRHEVRAFSPLSTHVHASKRLTAAQQPNSLAQVGGDETEGSSSSVSRVHRRLASEVVMRCVLKDG